MDISSLINAGLLSGALMASHEGSHSSAASDSNVLLRWGGDKYSFDNATPRAAAEIQGAGFSGQDRLKNALNNTEQDRLFSGINALHKLTYLLRDRGDISGMEKASGNKHTDKLVAASALWDLLKGSGVIDRDAGNVDFTTIDGAPGLVYRKRF